MAAESLAVRYSWCPTVELIGAHASVGTWHYISHASATAGCYAAGGACWEILAIIDMIELVLELLVQETLWLPLETGEVRNGL